MGRLATAISAGDSGFAASGWVLSLVCAVLAAAAVVWAMRLMRGIAPFPPEPRRKRR